MYEISESMDNLLQIQVPIQEQLNEFCKLFSQSLSHTDGLLNQALSHIQQRGGKRMRPILTLLMAKGYGQINESTLHGAVALELLHTASLVHDDVVDESRQRRGQASVNALYDNKVAVLVGDYLLSTSMLHVSETHNEQIFKQVALLGRTLSNGEILQLTNDEDDGLSEDIYYDVIRQKTAALFETCCAVAALSVGATQEEVEQAAEFGRNIGTIFQIRDDIFDYYDSKVIGKPTGNDMAEGKLTLPIIYALRNNDDLLMHELAKKVKFGSITTDEIAVLVEFAKQNGGIEYACQRMSELSEECCHFVSAHIKDEALANALLLYVDYVSSRNM